MADTIVALATPVGRSGIGVIRLSGPGSLAIALRMSGGTALDPRTAHLAELRDPANSDLIDQAVITYFKAPNSFTGEDVIEISCHGSPVLLRRVIDICLSEDARMAEAGEFTLRALANGKMNLAEAEAVRDLIDAQTAAAARQAIRQLRGEFSNQLQPIKDELLDVIVILESALEFVEDDLPDTQAGKLRSALAEIARTISGIAGTFQAGRLIREGLKVALVGRPNVGKSSVFNALLETDRAIVTDIAGTTRDQIHEKFSVNNIPISLIDTAGLRETDDVVESIGVERSRKTMADADLIMAILDVSGEVLSEDIEILRNLQGLNHLIVVNKTDLTSPTAAEEFISNISQRLPDRSTVFITVSAKTGIGIEELRNAITEPFAPEDLSTGGLLVTDARHYDLLLRANAEVEHAMSMLDQKMSEEIVLIGLHNALRYLGQITGETTTEDMLTRIFSTFCIGK